MPQTRFVPGVGPADFPDTMSEEEIQAVINRKAAEQVPELKGLPGVPLPTMDIKPLGPMDWAKAQLDARGVADKADPVMQWMNRDATPNKLTEGEKQRAITGTMDLLGGFTLGGGPIGATLSTVIGSELDKQKQRNPKEVIGSYLGAGSGYGVNALLNGLTGGKATALNELRKGIATGLGQYGGEVAVGGDSRRIIPALSGAFSGVMGAGLQGLSNKLNEAPRLLSNALVKDMLDGTELTSNEVFTSNRSNYASKPVREIIDFLKRDRDKMTPPEKGLHTMANNEFKGVVSGPLSVTPNKLSKALVPNTPNVNEFRRWEVLRRSVSPEAYEGAKKIALMETINKHFNASTGELQPSLMKQLADMKASGVLNEMMGSKEKAEAVIRGLDSLIKAQKAMYKASPGELMGHAAGAAATSGGVSAYHIMKGLAKVPGYPMRSMNLGTPNLAEVALGVAEDPSKYQQSLQWLAKHGADAPTSLVRAVVSTLNTKQ